MDQPVKVTRIKTRAEVKVPNDRLLKWVSGIESVDMARSCLRSRGIKEGWYLRGGRRLYYLIERAEGA